MKKNKGFSKVGIVIAVLSVAFVGLIAWAYNDKKQADAELDNIDDHSILDASEKSGDMPDNYFGPKDAKLVIFEYADYQCPACSLTFPYLSDVVEEYDGKVALVFRSFIMSYHKNGTAAASAANAAALQGYWHEYASLLFANQDEWENLDASSRDARFDEYFKTATKEKGDLDKFHSDISSEKVKDKISFDASLAKKQKIRATPSIFIGEKEFKFDTVEEEEFKKLFRAAVDEALAK